MMFIYTVQIAAISPASGGQLSIQAKMRIPNNVTWGI